jgi:hypothetical protein
LTASTASACNFPSWILLSAGGNCDGEWFSVGGIDDGDVVTRSGR